MKQLKYIIPKIVIIGISTFTIIVVYFLLKVWTWNRIPFNTNHSIDYNAFGTFGDFFGGFIGTLFAILGVIFVYFTYINQIDYQEKEQIESRFFELVKLHKDNVETLKKNDDNIFAIYIKNIVNFSIIIKKYCFLKNKKWLPKDQTKLGYLLFFYGTIDLSIENIRGINIQLEEIHELNKYIRSQGIKHDGSYEKFGIYFRQLFQIVNYINQKKVLSYKEKYDYIKTLRVNLNIEEQYLLFLNSLVSSGLNWEKEFEVKQQNRSNLFIFFSKKNHNFKLITKYNLLKNIPKEFKPIEGIDFNVEYGNIFYEYLGNVKPKKRRKIERSYS